MIVFFKILCVNNDLVQSDCVQNIENRVMIGIDIFSCYYYDAPTELGGKAIS